MRIKKKTRALMLTAAAVAACGVAAVSFAAWKGDSDNIAAKAETGAAYLFGFSQAQADGEKLELGKLVPYDQENGIIDGVRFVSVALPEYTVVGNYTITVAYKTETTLDFYAFVGAEVTAVPENWSPENKGDWQQVNATGVTFTFNGANGDLVNADGNKTVYASLMLVSEESADMNSAADFTITLATAD